MDLDAMPPASRIFISAAAVDAVRELERYLVLGSLGGQKSAGRKRVYRPPPVQELTIPQERLVAKARKANFLYRSPWGRVGLFLRIPHSKHQLG